MWWASGTEMSDRQEELQNNFQIVFLGELDHKIVFLLHGFDFILDSDILLLHLGHLINFITYNNLLLKLEKVLKSIWSFEFLQCHDFFIFLLSTAARIISIFQCSSSLLESHRQFLLTYFVLLAIIIPNVQ